MSKKVFFIVSLLIVASLLLTACGPQEAPAVEEAAP